MSIPSSHHHGCGCSGGQPARPAPDWIRRAEGGSADTLDVRPILAKGGEPFDVIMTAAKRVAAGGILILEAPFDPEPLKSVLGKQGFEAYSQPVGPEHWRIYFHRRPVAAAARPESGSSRTWYEGGELHIDVRGLAAPQPMLAILKLIDGDAQLSALVVHHEREPHFLYPELAERGWIYALLLGEQGEVRLRLTRSSP